MMKKRSKPTPGHKRGAVSHGFAVNCECGWRSSTWYGPGALGSANAEWFWHVERHKKEAKDT